MTISATIKISRPMRCLCAGVTFRGLFPLKFPGAVNEKGDDSPLESGNLFGSKFALLWRTNVVGMVHCFLVASGRS